MLLLFSISVHFFGCFSVGYMAHAIYLNAVMLRCDKLELLLHCKNDGQKMVEPKRQIAIKTDAVLSVSDGVGF